MKRVLVATDGSDGASRAVDAAAELAKVTGSELVIATIGGEITGAELRRLAGTGGDLSKTLEAKADGYDPLTQGIPALKAGETRQTTLTLKTTPKEPLIPTGTEVGQRAPDFTLPDMNGKRVTLSDYRGKRAILLAFHRGTF